MAEACAGWTDKAGDRHDCQFGDEERVRFPGGKTYCRFHLPMGEPGQGGKADWNEDRQAAISDAIIDRTRAENEKPEDQREKLDFSGVVVPAALDLSKESILWIDFRLTQFHDAVGFEMSQFQGDASFFGARFSRDAKFGGAQFHGEASFGAVRFGEHAWFGGAQFHADVTFEEAVFIGVAQLDKTHFHRDAWFRKARFQEDAWFGRAEFRRVASFNEAQFYAVARFDGARFQQQGFFAAAEFHGNVIFEKSQFQGDSLFREALFEVDASFGEVQFQKHAWFDETRFHGDARFDMAQFSRDARFDKAQFHRRASFGKVRFHEHAWFDETQFLDGVEFAGSLFQKNAVFGGSADAAQSDARQFNEFRFDNAYFSGAADFSNREFRDTTDFSNCVFMQAPSFHGSTLHQDTAFGGIECFPDVSSDGAERAYRSLRQAMEELRARLEEGMFYALEQKSRRRRLKNYDPVFLISLGYELGSNYGLSVVRPLLWLVGGVFASAIMLLFVGVFGGAGGAGTALNNMWNDALLFSIRQTFLPFDALRSPNEILETAYSFNPGGTGWLRAWGMVLSLFEVPVGLLLVLAVRWRYRR